MSKVNIRNASKGIKCLPPCTSTGQPMLSLQPGAVTPVDEERLMALDENKVVRNWFSSGDLEPVDGFSPEPQQDEETDAGDDEVEGKVETDTPVLPLTLADLTVAKAVPLLDETDDPHLLRLWLDAEERVTLRDAIASRIAELAE